MPTMPWPTSGWASFLRGNEMEKAAEHLRQSVAIDANHAEANFIAMILRSDDDLSLAKSTFSERLTSTPTMPSPITNLRPQ